MLGSIGIAAICIFLILVWITVLSSVATVVFYKLRFSVAFAIVASVDFVSLVLTAGHTIPFGDSCGYSRPWMPRLRYLRHSG